MHSLRFRCDAMVQHLYICPSVREHLYRHRQLERRAPESGGQLFGVIKNDSIRIQAADGPYRCDERTRTSYRSDPVSAQSAIDRRVSEGLCYLGEWHTHPQKVPLFSELDAVSFLKLIKLSDLRVNRLILLVQGTSSQPEGIAIASSCGNEFQYWHPLE